MRTIRNLLYLVIGVLLGATAVVVKAETIPTTNVTKYQDVMGVSPKLGSIDEVCAYITPSYQASFGVLHAGPSASYSSGWACVSYTANFSIGVNKLDTQGCQSGYTLNAEGTACFKPDSCPSDQVWDAAIPPSGACAPKCTGNQTRLEGTTECKCNTSHLNDMAGERPWFSGTGSTPSTLCDGGCSRGTGFGLGGGGSYTVQGGAFTGDKCTAESTKGNEIKSKKPPCAATEGVMTSTSGTVACVPEGTPNARKPTVQKNEKVETYPDNSTKKTETVTTTDPATGAKDTASTVTSSGGMSGTAGTSTTGTATTGSGTAGGKECSGENCTSDPTKGAFGDYGELWKKKYPDGIEGLLNEKYTAMKNTPVFKVVTDLAPSNIGTSGSCPSWSFSANIGPKMNFGSGSYAPPCWLWSALRVVFLITALLTARRLVFGG